MWSIAAGLLYAVPASEPWVVREASPPGARPPRLLDRVREAIRTRHYSRRTEKAYVNWIRRFIFFHDKRHPAEMGAREVTAFLTSLAVRDKVAASTQNQALSALLFLHREVLGVELPWLEDVVRAKRPQYLPVVLTRDETRALLQRLNGVPRVMALLLYGTGLRLLECCRLRVKDVDFAMNQIVIRDGKGRKDRVTMLPAAAQPLLLTHVDDVRAQHEAELSRRRASWSVRIGSHIQNSAKRSPSSRESTLARRGDVSPGDVGIQSSPCRRSSGADLVGCSSTPETGRAATRACGAGRESGQALA